MNRDTSEQSVESFAPKLRADVEQIPLPEGDTGLYQPAGAYLRVGQKLAPLLPSMDGQHTLADIAVRGGAECGRSVSIGALLGLVTELARGGWLDNAEPQIEAHGLPTRAPAKTIARRLLGGLLYTAISETRLGPLSSRVVAPFGVARPGTLALTAAAVVLLITLAALLVGVGVDLPANPLALRGSYGAGLLAVYWGATVTLTLRQLARGWVLGAEKVGVYGAGVELRLLVLAPYFDGRHIFRTGRAGELRLALGGLWGAGLGVLLLTTLALLVSNANATHLMGLATFGGYAVLFGIATPFLSTDLGRVVDLSYPGGDGRRHALSYLRRRLLRGQGSRTLFAGEVHHVLVAAATVLWVYIGFSGSAHVVRALLQPAALLPTAELPPHDAVIVGTVFAVAALLLIICVLVFIGGVLRFFASLLPRHAAAPRHLASDEDSARRAFEQCALFVHVQHEAQKRIAQAAELVQFKKGQDVICQGDVGDTFYLIAEGEAAVLHTADSGLESTVATLHAGDGFGEVALLEGSPRTATVRALTKLIVYSLRRDPFLAALEQAGVPAEQVTALLRATHALRGSDVFRHMAPATLAKVVARCARSNHAAGEVVIQEGDAADSFYVIESGCVVVEAERSDGVLAQLQAGDYFGEVALLQDAPRNATVRCETPSVLLALDRNSFREIMGHDFSAAVRLEQVAYRRATGGV